MSFDNIIQALKGGAGSGNFGHAGRPGKLGGSIAMSPDKGGAGGGWSTIGEGISSYTRNGNNYTKEDPPYTVNIKFTPRTVLGKRQGERATITVDDRTLRPGIAHEPIRLDSNYGERSLNKEYVANMADEYLDKIKRGVA